MDSGKMRFINRILEDQGGTMLRLQGSEMENQGLRESGTLIGTRRAVVSENTLDWFHPIYERFLDMKRTTKAGKRKKGRRIHNRFIMGHFSEIIKRVSHEYTEELSDDIHSAWGKSNDITI